MLEIFENSPTAANTSIEPSLSNIEVDSYQVSQAINYITESISQLSELYNLSNKNNRVILSTGKETNYSADEMWNYTVPEKDVYGCGNGGFFKAPTSTIYKISGIVSASNVSSPGTSEIYLKYGKQILTVITPDKTNFVLTYGVSVELEKGMTLQVSCNQSITLNKTDTQKNKIFVEW